MKASKVEGKDKNAILEEMIDRDGAFPPGSEVHEQRKAGIVVRCTEDIEISMNSLKEQLIENSKSSHELSNRLFWLNGVLTVATVLGAVATVLMAIKSWSE